VRSIYLSHLRALVIGLCPLAFFASSAFGGSVAVASPRAGSTVSGAVPISASANENTPFHLEIWDNDRKLGNFPGSVNTTVALPQGGQNMTVMAVSNNNGAVLNQSGVNFTVKAATAPAPPASPSSPSAAGGVGISSPHAGSTVSGSVPISVSANENTPFHLELWDNGRKLGDYFSTSVNTTMAMPQGGHNMTAIAVANNGSVLGKSGVTFNVGAGSKGSGGVNISSPTPGSTSISAVRIAASANENTSVHLEMWDNGYKLGSVSAGNVNGVYVLPNGPHVLTVQAIDNNNGSMISDSTVNYNVAENCSNSNNQTCNLDQIGVDDTQHNCNPPIETRWVANPCGPGIQGVNPTDPQSTLLQAVDEGNNPPNQGSHTLNGRSLHVQEVQGYNPSNVLFRGQSPATTGGTIDSHWTLDQYVYLPDPAAHQAFEMDAQYTAGGIWTKFYTECAFNQNNGTGFWGVFDSETGGWIFLNGKSQHGQTPPVVPCNRSQFSQPWAGSGDPSFTGWHHIAWTFYRNGDGTVTFQTLTFDGTTTQVNFHPNSKSGGNVNDYGNFSSLIQLDGIVNHDRQHDVVDAYVSEINLTHTP